MKLVGSILFATLSGGLLPAEAQDDDADIRGATQEFLLGFNLARTARMDTQEQQLTASVPLEAQAIESLKLQFLNNQDCEGSAKSLTPATLGGFFYTADIYNELQKEGTAAVQITLNAGLAALQLEDSSERMMSWLLFLAEVYESMLARKAAGISLSVLNTYDLKTPLTKKPEEEKDDGDEAKGAAHYALPGAGLLVASYNSGPRRLGTSSKVSDCTKTLIIIVTGPTEEAARAALTSAGAAERAFVAPSGTFSAAPAADARTASTVAAAELGQEAPLRGRGRLGGPRLFGGARLRQARLDEIVERQEQTHRTHLRTSAKAVTKASTKAAATALTVAAGAVRRTGRPVRTGLPFRGGFSAGSRSLQQTSPLLQRVLQWLQQQQQQKGQQDRGHYQEQLQRQHQATEELRQHQKQQQQQQRQWGQQHSPFRAILRSDFSIFGVDALPWTSSAWGLQQQHEQRQHGSTAAAAVEDSGSGDPGIAAKVASGGKDDWQGWWASSDASYELGPLQRSLLHCLSIQLYRRQFQAKSVNPDLLQQHEQLPAQQRQRLLQDHQQRLPQRHRQQMPQKQQRKEKIKERTFQSLRY
ncbi:hypothetical protein Emag_006762 [Eimeria magna]